MVMDHYSVDVEMLFVDAKLAVQSWLDHESGFKLLAQMCSLNTVSCRS